MTDQHDTTELKASITRLTRDLVKAAATLSDDEVRYLVDGYYLMQEGRKRASNQVRAMDKEPTLLLAWLAEHLPGGARHVNTIWTGE